MRDAYYDQLRAIVDDVVGLTGLVRRSLASATLALLEADRTLAEQVIADDDRIDSLTNDIEDRSFLIMATQQPVAGDLRQLVATMRIIADLERMGDHAVHIAKVARMREPEIAVPEQLQSTIRSMGQVADAMIAAASHIVAERDVEAAHELERKDDEMDKLHRQLFRTLLERLVVLWGRSGDRRGVAEPVLRAHRRPRGIDGPPDDLPGDRYPRTRVSGQ